MNGASDLNGLRRTFHPASPGFVNSAVNCPGNRLLFLSYYGILFPQCAAVMFDTTELTSRWCFLETGFVVVPNGNNTLYVRCYKKKCRYNG